MIASSVDFPHPLGPVIAKLAPDCTFKETVSSAVIGPDGVVYRLESEVTERPAGPFIGAAALRP
jgi:hypothetical protein